MTGLRAYWRAYWALWCLVALLGLAFIAGYWAATMTAIAMLKVAA
jgi:ABC-type microcin C transport system permease subunit YejE